MKRLAAAAVFVGVLGWAGMVEAACSTTTYIMDGRVVVCTTCCWGVAGCTVTCQ